MLCYRDRTFCTFYKLCKKGHSCSSALTPDIAKGAQEMELPIAQFAEFPTCFVRFFDPSGDLDTKD